MVAGSATASQPDAAFGSCYGECVEPVKMSDQSLSVSPDNLKPLYHRQANLQAVDHMDTVSLHILGVMLGL